MEEENRDHLLLKWGTLKGWCFKNSPEAWEHFKEYCDLGMSFGAMQQNDTDRQKELICLMIDKINGPISNDWTGETYATKEDAKRYVLEYNSKRAKR